MDLRLKLQIYGLFGFIKLLMNTFLTRICYPKARLIRRPIEIRGRRFINFGVNLTTGVGCRIEAYPFVKNKTIIHFGKNIEINDYVHIAGISSVKIGDNVLIASKVYISDIQHGNYSSDGRQDEPQSVPKDRALSSKDVIIHENVWIGESVSIMPGVTIGKGAIIGANSVVTKNIPESTICAGIPAKVIKQYNPTSKTWKKVN